jgi:hypothetical protein
MFSRSIGLDSWKPKSARTVINAVGAQGNVAAKDVHTTVASSEGEVVAWLSDWTKRRFDGTDERVEKGTKIRRRQLINIAQKNFAQRAKRSTQRENDRKVNRVLCILRSVE